MATTQTNAEDKTYENEVQEVVQLKNIIDSKEAEITAFRSINDEHRTLNGKLRKEHIEEIEKVKKEADQLMINKIIKYEKQIKQLKKDAKEMLNYP